MQLVFFNLSPSRPPSVAQHSFVSEMKHGNLIKCTEEKPAVLSSSPCPASFTLRRAKISPHKEPPWPLAHSPYLHLVCAQGCPCLWMRKPMSATRMFLVHLLSGGAGCAWRGCRVPGLCGGAALPAHGGCGLSFGQPWHRVSLCRGARVSARPVPRSRGGWRALRPPLKQLMNRVQE